MKEAKSEFLGKVEEEALDVLKNFKNHPVKSILISILILWAIKKVYNFIKEF
jgi:hypothetical protein